MESQGKLEKARLIARELWALMREDASHRLGIAHDMPEANDRIWSQDFYRRCQLAERLHAILDELAAGDGVAPPRPRERVNGNCSANGENPSVPEPMRSR